MKNILIAAALLFSLQVYAQHDHTKHEHAKDVKKAPPKDSVRAVAPVPTDTVPKPRMAEQPAPPAAPAPAHDHGAHDHEAAMPMEHHDHGSMTMSHAFSRNLPMTRNGSGTSWQPDNAPMFGYMIHGERWMHMIHGSAFLRYNKQDLLDKGSRGGDQWDAPNMVMWMGQRNIGSNDIFHFSAMLSLDPVTVGASGYPLLFQTGESYKDKPLVDRQHPHDLFSELSVSYAHALSPKSDVFVYLGYPGEPALGPTAFVHRQSGFFNPDAPLTHHWVDATHISFGVATAGFRYGNWKWEASSFTGREPDEHRYDFDKPRFDSWSGRISFNPTPAWATQVSHGFIREPEVLHPGEDVSRTTASVSYSRRGFGAQFTNVTAVWGMNKTPGHDAEHGALLEAAYNVRRTAVYGRTEWVQKSIEELSLDETAFGHDAIFPVYAFTGGASYDIIQKGNTRVALGAQLSFYNPDKRLAILYGDNPIAAQVYLRLYPGVMGERWGRLFLPQ